MVCAGDCDDTDPAVHPDTFERCRNGIDDNCDFLTDAGDEICLDEHCLDLEIVQGDLVMTLLDAADPACETNDRLDDRMSVIWGDVDELQEVAGKIDLGQVHELDCWQRRFPILFDTLRPDPGKVDFILARRQWESDYGSSSDGLRRTAQNDPCP